MEKLNEEIRRIRKVMGLIYESTDKLSTKNNETVLVSDWAKNHIKQHNEFGTGSVFKEGITDEDIVGYVNMILENNDLGGGGAFEIEVPGIGYDLVIPIDEALSLENAQQSTTIKKEGKNEIEVPLIRTTESADNFLTNRLTLIIRPTSDIKFLPPDVQEDTEIIEKLGQGKIYSLLSAFPGNPNIPRASEWNNQFAVVVPKKIKPKNAIDN